MIKNLNLIVITLYFLLEHFYRYLLDLVKSNAFQEADLIQTGLIQVQKSIFLRFTRFYLAKHRRHPQCLDPLMLKSQVCLPQHLQANPCQNQNFLIQETTKLFKFIFSKEYFLLSPLKDLALGW